MGTAPIVVRATGADLKKIARELRKMDDKEVGKRFRKELRAAAAPFVPAVRSSIASIPVKGQKSTGLRKRLQKAVTLRVKTTGKNASVSILMSTAKMPDGQKALPAYMEGTKPRWRHPVFGDTDNWKQQDSHPYFFPVMRSAGTSARLAVDRMVKQITVDIT